MADCKTEVRQPTREQKREIIDFLKEVYDTKTERYKGGESDVTVAEAVGEGCMFGWVATIREELFGPDGRNEELEDLIKAFNDWGRAVEISLSLVDTVAEEARRIQEQLLADQRKMADMRIRLDALVKAAGPRAKHLA